jgi:hypothetical protein
MIKGYVYAIGGAPDADSSFRHLAVKNRNIDFTGRPSLEQVKLSVKNLVQAGSRKLLLERIIMDAVTF